MISGIDIICGAVLLILAVFGLRAGFLSGFLSLLSVYFSVYISSGAAGFAANGSSALGADRNTAYTVIFLFIFLFVYFIGEFVIWALKKVITVQLLGMLDSVLAAVLGAVKALFIMGIVFNLVAIFPVSPATKDLIEKSFFKRIALRVYRESYPFAKEAIPRAGKMFRGDNPVSSPLPKAIVSKTIETMEIISKEAAEVKKELTQ